MAEKKKVKSPSRSEGARKGHATRRADAMSKSIGKAAQKAPLAGKVESRKERLK